jgi:hypothetical protein
LICDSDRFCTLSSTSPRGASQLRAAGIGKAGQTIQIVYDPAKPTSMSPVGQEPRWVGLFIMGLGAVVFLGVLVYFAYRAWRRREKYSDDD